MNLLVLVSALYPCLSSRSGQYQFSWRHDQGIFFNYRSEGKSYMIRGRKAIGTTPDIRPGAYPGRGEQ